MSERNRIALGWIALGVAWLAMLVHALSGAAILDEVVHWSQVKRFINGDYRVYTEALTNVPGYHWFLTGLLWPFGTDALWPMRVATALMLACCVLLFHRIRHALHPADAQRAAAQFLFLPVMFVYGFMAYTDVPALMFLLAAWLATLHGRHRTSALLLLASMAMRQNQVLWVVFLGVYAAWPILVDVAKASPAERRSARFWRAWAGSIARIVWPYVLAVLCFCAYWAWNGSISYSTAQSRVIHPDMRLDIGNPVYLLALAAVLFPLQMLEGWKRLAGFGRRPGGWWVWALPLAAFVTYALLFKVHHPYNLNPDNILRNQWLQLVVQGGAAWWVFGALATWGCCGLLFQRYVLPQGWLWLPFSLVFVGASWMIETRYTIVPFVLFLALRRPAGVWAERVTLAGWIALSGWLAWNVFDHRFML